MQQHIALDILKTGRNVYLTGPAGSGKTHVLSQYIAYLKQHHVGIGITASTGIAATHLNGMTIHAWSGIGIKEYLSDWDLDALGQRQPLVKRLSATDVLIIDEVSMLRPEVLDMVDQVTREIKRVDAVFGGMQVVLSGDFFQLPPVVRDARDEAFIDSAQAWHEGNFRVCYLHEQHRQKSDPLLGILNDIRDGAVSESTKKLLSERLSQEEQDEGAVVLHTHNADVDAYNEKELEKLEGLVCTFEMTATGRAHVVETLKRGVLALEQLRLKIGARVMFVKNAPDYEYVNGTLGEIVDLSGAYPVVKTHNGNLITATPVSWEVVDNDKIVASVMQVPLRLAWAITVHKSQGMTLDAVDVDLSRAFAPGQGYVALSRARTLNGLHIRGFNEQALAVHPYVSELDIQLQAQSLHWEAVFTQFSDEKVDALQSEFITRVAREAPVAKLPTHLETRLLIEEQYSLTEIAQKRNLTVGTIIGHLEKLREKGDSELFAYLLDAEGERMQRAVEAFGGDADAKLTPIHRALKGAYTFDELRFARLFV